MIIHLTHLLHLWRGPEYVGVLFPDEVDMLNLASLERAQVKEVKIDGRSSWEVVRGLACCRISCVISYLHTA